MALPSPLGRDMLAARAFPSPRLPGLEPPSPAPERGGCGRAFDCRQRRWPAPRARLRITLAPGTRVCPHTLRGRCSRASHAACQSQPPAAKHTLTQACHSIPSSWQAPRASGGAGWARAWGTCRPAAPGPHAVLLLACPGRRLLGTFHLCEAGGVRFHRDKATQPCTGCLALRRNSRVVNVLFMASS